MRTLEKLLEKIPHPNEPYTDSDIKLIKSFRCKVMRRWMHNESVVQELENHTFDVPVPLRHILTPLRVYHFYRYYYMYRYGITVDTTIKNPYKPVRPY